MTGIDLNKNAKVDSKTVRELHYNADTDGSPKAIHHTLGPGANQAAPGNHTHDGGQSATLDKLDPNIARDSGNVGSAGTTTAVTAAPFDWTTGPTVTFTAPDSGAVEVYANAYLKSGADGTTFSNAQVVMRQGSTIGSGTVVGRELFASNYNGQFILNPPGLAMVKTGLTPGSTYHVHLAIYTGNATYPAGYSTSRIFVKDIR